jgi:hypothetical protein
MRRRQLIGFGLAVAVCLFLAFRPRGKAPIAGNSDGGTRVAQWSSDAGAPRTDGGMAISGARGKGVIVGDVFDARGWPIAGASVRVQLLDGTGAMAGGAGLHLEPAGELGILSGPLPFPPKTPLPRPSVAAVLSDDKGRFTIGELPVGRMVVLASHPDFVDGRSEELVLAEAGQGRVQIALAAGRTVAIRVVDDRGPLPGAELWRSVELAGTTDAQGRYSMGRLPAAPVEIEARARGYVTRKTTLDPGGPAEIELHLDRAGGRVTGIVVDERGFPVVSAKVVATVGGATIEAVSDPRGEFAIEGAPEGELALRVTHDDHPAASRQGIAAGDDIRIALLAGAGLDGDVRDDRTSAPLPAARITADSGGETRSVQADKKGRWKLYGLPAGKATLKWKAPGYLEGTKIVDLPPGERAREITLRDLRLELALGGFVSGVVRDDRGGVVPGLDVVIAGEHGRTDAGGHFKIGPIAAGKLEIRAGNASDQVIVDAGRTTLLELRTK